MWVQYSVLGRRFMFCGSNCVSTDWEKASSGSLLVFTPDLDVFGGYVLNPQMGCSVSVWPPSRTEFGTSCRFQFWRGCRKCLKSSCYKVIHQNPRHSFTLMKDFCFIFFLSLSSFIWSPSSSSGNQTHHGAVFFFFKFKPPFFCFADVFSQYVSFQFLEIISIISPASSTFQQMFSSSFALCDGNLAHLRCRLCFHLLPHIQASSQGAEVYHFIFQEAINKGLIMLFCFYCAYFWLISGCLVAWPQKTKTAQNFVRP